MIPFNKPAFVGTELGYVAQAVMDRSPRDAMAGLSTISVAIRRF